MKRRYNLRIWGLALGYFIFYAPFSMLVKMTSTGLSPVASKPVTGFVILPATAIGTAAMMMVSTSLLGWWKHARRRRLFNVSVLCPDPLVILSGLGTAIIIITTTLAYTFTGVSILFALLLMRGGVLIVAPILDFIFRRRVRWFSTVALCLSLAALAVTLFDVSNYRMSVVAWLNIAGYLAGYMLRLPCMNKLGKSEDKNVSYRYFVEEQMVAAILLVTIPAALAVAGHGSMMMELRYGFASFFTNSATAPGLLIGALYASLYFFGTLIYLDARENTFCVPLNRGSSLLSVLVASHALALFFNQDAPSAAQLTASGLIVVALIYLTPLHHGHRVAARLKRLPGDAYRAGLYLLGRQRPARATASQTALQEDSAVINDLAAEEDRHNAK